MNKRISIGIRVTPSCIFYAIYQETEDEIITTVIDKLKLPTALEIPEQLKYVRSTFIDILNEFSVNLACIRVTESAAQNPHFFRISIEAVIQELFASSEVEHYYSGQISSISSKLGFNRDQFNEYKDGKLTFMEMEEWADFSSEVRESIMASISALKLN